MLLFRRQIELSADTPDKEIVTPLTVSVYRDNLDPGYQMMMQGLAKEGLFDLFFMAHMENVLKSGKYSVGKVFIMLGVLSPHF